MNTKNILNIGHSAKLLRRFSFSIFSVIALLLASCSKSNGVGKTYVIVHGAFQAGYAWDEVKTALEQKGQKVIVVELPGHGADTTNPASINMALYRNKVLAAINTVQGKVILVGHSMGGMVISAVAESAPGRIEKLVYLAAFVPQNGQSLFQLASQDSIGELGPLLVPSADYLTIGISDISKIPDVFCADGSSQVKQELVANYRPEPAIPFNDPASLTSASFGSVDKYYIHTLDDKALGIKLQNQMVAAAGITKIYSISSSHCPQLSMPAQLTNLLITIGK